MKRIYSNFLRWTFVLLLSLLSNLNTYSQQNKTIKVSGVVKDEYGDPVVGGSIKVKDNTIGTVTDIDGRYVIQCLPNAELQYSYVGCQTITEKVNNRTIINITLKSSVEDLEEVVVVAYGHQKKLSVTGSVSSVVGKDLLKVPTASVGNMLSGVMSGVSTVQFSGQPGADNPDIFVRGIGTLNSQNATPLMLVDGVERSFFNMDPNEIENISILKDASSTAVFGVRGANGVILVTTKRGSTSKPQMSASFSYGIQSPTRMVEMVNSYEWASLHNLVRDMDGQGDMKGFSDEALYAFKNHTNLLAYPDTDWNKMLFKKSSPQSQGNVNISGGTESVKYFASLGYLHQDGFFNNFDLQYNGNFGYKRYNYRTNLDINMTKTSKVSLNIGGTLEQTNTPNANGGDLNQIFRYIYWATPISGAGIVDGKWVLANKRFVGDYVGNDGLSGYYGRGSRNYSKNALNIDLAFNQNLDFITKGLNFKLKGAYNTAFGHVKNINCSVENYTPLTLRQIEDYYTPNPDLDPSDLDEVFLKSNGVGGDRSYSEGSDMSRNWYAEIGLDYNRNFGKHHVTALLLYNQSRTYYPTGTQYSEIPTGYVGTVGRITYDYNTTYLLEFNVGCNGSENFPVGKRYGLFPAVSLGWIISQENFMKSQNFINYMKLRGSYGIVGNDNSYFNGTRRRYFYMDNAYYSGGGYIFGSESSRFWSNGFYEGTIGNPDVGWEKAHKQNIGIDFNILNNRLSFNVDGFTERRSNILWYPETFPSYSALILPPMNIGKVNNKGIEVAVKWEDKIGDFNYYARMNVSYAKNKIINMDEIPTNNPNNMRTGHSVGQPFGYKVRGLYYPGMPNVANHYVNLLEGDLVYADDNNDGLITKEDEVAIGYPNYPLLNAGLTLGFRYKGWDFSALITGATMTSRVLEETFRTPYGDKLTGPVLKYQFENTWTTENKNGYLPRLTFQRMANNYNVNSEMWVRDASYLRLKNIQIAYTFKSPKMKKIGISEIRPYINGYNLFTIDKLKFIDPENPASSRPAYPVMLVTNIGVNINF